MIQPSFQTTYEELKLGILGKVGSTALTLPDYLWGIETDFKMDSGFMGESCFQTTYEELKPVSWTSAWHPPLWPLPDYLWGIETDLVHFGHCSGSIRLPDYLWGIETPQAFSKPSEHCSLPDYLWGIETNKFHVTGGALVFCFQTTYEELKLDFS